MNKISNQFSSIEQITDQYLKQNSQNTVAAEGELSFDDILKQKQFVDESSVLKFSKHASMRLQSRNIELSTEQKERLETAAEKQKRRE